MEILSAYTPLHTSPNPQPYTTPLYSHNMDSIKFHFYNNYQHQISHNNLSLLLINLIAILIGVLLHLIIVIWSIFYNKLLLIYKIMFHRIINFKLLQRICSIVVLHKPLPQIPILPTLSITSLSI